MLPRALEVLGALGFLYLIFSGWVFRQSFALKLFFAVYLLFYILIRVCASLNWYSSLRVPSLSRDEAISIGGLFRRLRRLATTDDRGIGLHFRKMLVAASYTIFIVNLLAILGAGFAIYLSAALFVFIFHINAILLHFHFRDKDSTPPNFYTKGMSS